MLVDSGEFDEQVVLEFGIGTQVAQREVQVLGDIVDQLRRTLRSACQRNDKTKTEKRLMGCVRELRALGENSQSFCLMLCGQAGCRVWRRASCLVSWFVA